MGNESVIEALREPFENTGRVPVGGGSSADYIEWTDAVRRLDDAVGSDNWEWRLSDLQAVGDGAKGYMLCKGSLTIHFPDGAVITKEQFGGNAYGNGMDPENAAKGAGSDALKKAAQLFGIAFNLAGKKQGGQGGAYQQQAARPQGGSPRAPIADDGDEYYCSECGEQIVGGSFGDGKPFSAAQAAGWSRKYNRPPLCRTHLAEAKKSAERGQQAQQYAASTAIDSLPF